VRASTPSSTGGFLTDVALAGRFAVGSDILFVNGVPIIDISTPATPIPLAILDFRQFGDDNGTGIAVDNAFVYLTTDRNRLLVGQYLQIEDTAGIPPTVRIAAPQAGATTVHGKHASSAAKTKELREVGNMPSCALALDFQRAFAGTPRNKESAKRLRNATFSAVVRS
jgi:hypothetical protein